jgi:signal transduction histidine kinase
MSRRPAEAGAPDEIGQLTGVLNRMLASLEAARAGERRLLADASHELRRPVTTLLGYVGLAARHGADAEVLEELQRDARRLARLVGDLLVLERAGGAAHAGGPVDLLARRAVDACPTLALIPDGPKRSRRAGTPGRFVPTRVKNLTEASVLNVRVCDTLRARPSGR